jgi:thiol-disulfide isomerase/thioredoxin
MTETAQESGRVWWVVGLTFVLGWALALYFLVPAPPPARNVPLLEGTGRAERADYGWTLHDLDGRAVPLSLFRGETVFLNIWATWCKPCVAELPSIAALARSPRLSGVKFVCVVTDDDREAVRSFLKGKDWPMTVLHATEAPAVFASVGVPATFLIAPDGQVAASVVGGADWDDPSVVAFLERLSGTQSGRSSVPVAPTAPGPAADSPTSAR